MSDFRIQLRTNDGQLVQNRKGKADDYYVGAPGTYYARLQESFVTATLETDCRQRGCRLISWTINKDTGVVGIVEWLK